MEQADEEMTAEDLIKSLEQTYFDLRQKHPDRDEHWFLANTWLERYGSDEEAKEKGTKWAKFTAYKETFEYAILEPPESIRALALILVFREKGEEEARQYESEFFRLMEPIVKSKENRVFIDEYKKRNPLTWKEVEVVDDSPYSLYWFFRGLELDQEHEYVGDEDNEFDIIDLLSESEEEEMLGF